MGNKEQSEQINEQATETAPLSKEDEKAARKARMWERRFARRIKRNARIARCRWLKNLIIWLMGVLFLPIAIAGAAFIIPISVITGNDGSIVSKDLSKRSVYEVARYVMMNSSELGFSDLPVITNALSDLQKTQIGEREDEEGNKLPITVGDIVYINTDKLNTIKFSGDIAGEVSSCIEVVATIESLGGASALGDFGGLNVFKDEEQVKYFKKIYNVAQVDAPEGLDTTAAEFEPAKYFYKTKEVDDTITDNVYKRAFKDDNSLVDELYGLTPENKALVNIYTKALCTVADVGVDGLDNTADSFEPKEYYYKTKEVDAAIEETVYKRAFNDDKSLVEELNGLSAEKKAEVYLYYPPLEKVKIGELKDIIGDSIGRTTISSLLETLGGGNPTITSILGEDTTIREIGNFDINETELDKVLPAPDTEHPEQNKKLYDILKDLTGKPDAKSIKVGDLSGLETDNLHLSVVLTPPDDTANPSSDEYNKNRKLYDILLDITPNEVNSYGKITVGNLSSIDTDKLHLNIVMGDISGNKVLTALKAKNITVGEIGTALNALSLYEVYGVDAFKAYDVAATTLDLDRSYYRVFDETGSAVYMLESNSIFDAAQTGYYICYTSNGTAVDKTYETEAARGNIITSTKYYKCTLIAPPHTVSFEPVSPDPDPTVYFVEDNVEYYKTANNFYVECEHCDEVYNRVNKQEYLVYSAAGVMSYTDTVGLGVVDTGTTYYKCTNKSTQDISFIDALSDPSTSVYDFDSKLYYKTSNNLYVRTNYDDDLYIDSLDALIKADNYEYFACYENETFISYLSDPTGYDYDDTVKYIKATDKWKNPDTGLLEDRTVYVLDERQYLDKSAGIWLLLSFDTAEYDDHDNATRRFADQHGKAYKYNVDNMTIESLQRGSVFAKKFKNSTIKQLVDSGLIDDPKFANPESYKYSLQGLLDVMKDKGL